MKIFLSCFILILLYPSQAKASFCTSVKMQKWKAVDQKVKSIILKHREGTLYESPTSSYYIYSPSLDSICQELNKIDCVDTALWDQYATKIAIYPGHSTIGVRFRTDTGYMERCYLVQEGGVKKLNSLLSWVSIYLQDRHRLFYKGSSFCTGFIEQQIEIFHQYKKEEQEAYKMMRRIKGFIPIQDVLGTWVNTENQTDTIYFYPNQDSGQVLLSLDGTIPTFMFNSEYGYVDTSGLFLMWGGYTSMIRMEEQDRLYLKFQTLDQLGEHRYTKLKN